MVTDGYYKDRKLLIDRKTQENTLNITKMHVRGEGGGGVVVWLWGPGIGSGSSRVNEYAAENDRGRLVLVASLPKNTYSARKHLQ